METSLVEWWLYQPFQYDRMEEEPGQKCIQKYPETMYYSLFDIICINYFIGLSIMYYGSINDHPPIPVHLHVYNWDISPTHNSKYEHLQANIFEQIVGMALIEYQWTVGMVLIEYQ